MNPQQLQLFGEIEDRHWWFGGRRAIVRRLAERILGEHGPIGRGGVVVDIGCGTGGNLGCLPASLRRIGVDASETAIQIAERRFPAIRFIQGFAPDAVVDVLPIADLVLMMDVLEHVHDDVRMLSENLACMKPGSHLLITVPADPAMWTVHDETVLHWRRYTPARLRATWQGLPVEERLFSHFNTRLWPIARVARAMSRRRGKAVGEAGTDLKLPPRPLNRMLEAVFAGEGAVLADAIDRHAVMPYARGVSLVAVLRRSIGRCDVRSRTSDHGEDQYDPERAIRL